ncbi:MAG: hypothetical protein CBD64_00185 [Flavobacteriaceae bacterium TMED204]|nr:MAG: hypothetical protein CBD64_00185 [Flavobacteriaceae bacterium TMED204]
MPTRTFIKFFGITIVLLLLPFVSSLFNDQIDWDVLDYSVMGSMIFTAISLFFYTNRKFKKTKSSYWIEIFILVIFLLLWAELAVGIFNTPFAGS